MVPESDQAGFKGRISPDRKVSMAEFAGALIPVNAELNFIISEDFDGDGEREALIGYRIYDPNQFTVLYIIRRGEGFIHHKLLTTAIGQDSIYDYKDGISGVFEGAFAADTNGDGNPELVLALTEGNGHFVNVYVFHWTGGLPVLAWKTDYSFYHGHVELDDIDGDGVYEITVEESTDYGKEILSMSEADIHVRESSMYKWNGVSYQPHPYRVRTLGHQMNNTAVSFLVSVWKGDYDAAYSITMLPLLLGVGGLDDDGPAAFRQFLNGNVAPYLLENLEKGRLRPLGENFNECGFDGEKHTIAVELYRDKDGYKVAKVNVYKKAE